MSDFTGTVQRTIEDDPDFGDVDYEVTGTISSYVPATWDSPAEGAALEDYSFRVVSVNNVPRKDLEASLVKKIETYIENVNDTKLFRDDLYEELAEMAVDSAETARETAYEQRYDR